MNLFHVIVLFGALQGLIIGTYELFFSPKKTPDGIFFSLALFGLAISLAGFIFREVYTVWNIPYLFFGPLFGPALYFYVVGFVTEAKKPERYWPHFIPFIALAVYTLVTFFTKTNPDEYVQWVLGVLPPLSMLVLGQITIYFVLGLIRLRRGWSRFEVKKYRWAKFWLTYLHVVYSLMLVTMVALTILGQTNATLDTRYLGYMLFLIATSVILYSLSLWRLLVPEIVKVTSSKSRSIPSAIANSTQSNGQMQALLKLMETEKPYRQPDISLDILAAMVGLNAKKLSFLLNTNAQVSFNDFINTYRVADVKQKLTDPTYSHLNIIALGLDAGFNSKSTFNAAFKKQVGETPLQFRKRLLDQ